MSETPPTAKPPAAADPTRERGLGSWLGILVGGGCLLMAGAGALNTAVGGHWALVVSGAEVELPTNYEVVAGLIAAGVLIIGLSLFGSFVADKFRAAKGKPAIRVGILVGAFALLAVVFRGLQIIALTQTYGSMLAYYATDGDLDDVAAELGKDPSTEDLDNAVSRAAQYDNVGALKLLLEAGADLRDSTGGEYRHCVLGGVGPEFVAVALEHDVTPDSCPDSEALIWQVVNGEQDDANTAKIVEMLAGAGWSTTAIPESNTTTPAEVAKHRGKIQTLALLGEG
jgi:hypothetical protein